MDLKLGKLAPTSLPRILFDDYAMGKPPAPPSSVAIPRVATWGMYGNNEYGDCVMAGLVHKMLAANVEVNENDAIPSTQQTVTQYFKLTGGQDTGLNIATTYEIWRREGLFPFKNKIKAWSPVSYGSILAMHRAIAFFGGLTLGIQLPQSAMSQFGTGPNTPWTVVKGSPILGGHDLEAVAYDAQYIYCVTWAAVVPVTYPFLATYADEAEVVIMQADVEAGHGPASPVAYDIKALQADLGHLSLS